VDDLSGVINGIPLIVGGDCAHKPVLNEYITVAAMEGITIAQAE
jgi:hypothetical protein